MRERRLHTLVVGSGAAGLCAAVRLHDLGVKDLAVYTEGLQCGTSINTGSDKQTYYKLGMYGEQGDAPVLMAADLAAGGSMHGDLALVEAAMSPLAFANLVAAGVPFPHDCYGQHIGYKTDHDPRRRATSVGPYTSRDMCRALIAQLQARRIEVCEKRILVKLFVSDGNCHGGLFVDLQKEVDPLELVLARNTVFAVGGPGGLYRDSVYPPIHTGAIGVALAAGAKARNLAESQFGLASVKFRWNLSGSYMQVLPRFYSVDESGNEREFLREFFPSTAAMYDAIFLKGYQWPFAASHLPGSSLIDLFVFRESTAGRKVFLDYRRDPDDLDFSALSEETRTYLERSNALGANPLERLQKLNAPAIELYRDHGIDLATEPLQCAVCAQHCNGGLAGDVWWQSENLRGLFPVGEVNGTHGVTRPGGSALNSGQVGAWRAAEYIAAHKDDPPRESPSFAWENLLARLNVPARQDWRAERRQLQARMSEAGAFLREAEAVEKALQQACAQLEAMRADGLAGAPRDLAERLRNEALAVASICYLDAIREHIASHAGSRGGAVVVTPSGQEIHSALSYRMEPEDESYRKRTLETTYSGGQARSQWVPVRPIPREDGWFESIWASFRKGEIYRS